MNRHEIDPATEPEEPAAAAAPSSRLILPAKPPQPSDQHPAAGDGAPLMRPLLIDI